jgi:transposase InsO family protein
MESRQPDNGNENEELGESSDRFAGTSESGVDTLEERLDSRVNDEQHPLVSDDEEEDVVEFDDLVDTSKPITKPKGPKKSPCRKLTPKAKLLILQAYRSSKLAAKVFGPLVGVSDAALYKWDVAFKRNGPAGLEGKKAGAPKGTRLPVETQQAILMLKEEHEDWGCQRIHDMLLRSDGFSASPGAIRRVLFDNGYEVVEEKVARHPDKPRRFERARPQQMYQTDIFTFLLKRERTRLYMIAYMDDHSRYIVGFGLTVKATSAWAQEVLGEAISMYGPPEEVLTDQGPQYHTWRGTSSYAKYLNKLGIRQIVARAHHPQTLGKVERFWKTLWAECVQKAIFKDINDARERIGQFVGWYNFRRTHQGIGGLVPADRFFGAEETVRKSIEERVAENALEIARHGSPRKPFYLTGRVGGESISLHAEGEKVVLTTDTGVREEVDLSATGRTDFEQSETVIEVEDALQGHDGAAQGGAA